MFQDNFEASCKTVIEQSSAWQRFHSQTYTFGALWTLSHILLATLLHSWQGKLVERSLPHRSVPPCKAYRPSLYFLAHLALKWLWCFPQETVVPQTMSLQHWWWREVYGIFLMPPQFTYMQSHHSAPNNMVASRFIHHRLQSPRYVYGVLHMLQI